MIDMEQELREAFASQISVRPNPVDLADRVIARGTTLRRRRIAAISTTGMLAVALLLTVTLIRLPGDPSGHAGDPAALGSGGTPAELAGLPVGKPVQLAVYGQHSLKLPDGTEMEINSDPDETVTDVVRAAEGAWVVRTASQTRDLPAVTMVRADDSKTTLGEAVVSMALTADRDRVAVQSRVGDGQRVEVIEVPSGQPVAATPLPGDVESAPVVSGWAGSLVVLSAPNGDAGPVGTDVWDPAQGPYRSTPSGSRLVLGRSAEPGQLLALEPDRPESPNACLTWVDPVEKFAVRARYCQTGLEFGEPPPWASPDGAHLVAWHPSHDGQIVAMDLRTMVSTALGLPEHMLPVDIGWEDPGTALVQVELARDRMDVLRCKLDGSPCEVAPTPQVDGGAQGFAD